MELERLAPRTAIVAVLEKHGTATVDFIAHQIGRNSEETERYLQSLEAHKVVQRQQNNVSLVKQ